MKPKVQNRSTKNDKVIRDLPRACADEAAAVEFMEAQRWGSDPCCPRCGSVDVYQMKDSQTGQRQKNFRWLCRDCKKAGEKCQYTVRTGPRLSYATRALPSGAQPRPKKGRERA